MLQLPATPAWDVWSLGCTLFEAATGTVLFGGLEQAAAALVADEPSSGSGDEAAGASGAAAWRWRGAAAAAAERRQQRLERRLDAAHLALARRLLGPAPLGVLERSRVAAGFYDARGEPLLPLPGRAPLEQRLQESGALDRQQVMGATHAASGVAWATGSWAVATGKTACLVQRSKGQGLGQDF